MKRSHFFNMLYNFYANGTDFFKFSLSKLQKKKYKRNFKKP
jgi:hypothetical protein